MIYGFMVILLALFLGAVWGWGLSPVSLLLLTLVLLAWVWTKREDFWQMLPVRLALFFLLLGLVLGGIGRCQNQRIQPPPATPPVESGGDAGRIEPRPQTPAPAASLRAQSARPARVHVRETSAPPPIARHPAYFPPHTFPATA